MDSLSSHFADVGGARLHYMRGGSGPLMLFVHGFPRHWFLWRHQLAAFACDHTVIALDQRGYNLSDKPQRDQEYGVWRSADDVLELADALNVDQFVLVGHDWGGRAAWSFALHHPDRLRGLVILNAAHPALLERELRTSPAMQSKARFMIRLRRPEAGALAAENDFERLRHTIEFPFISDADRQVYVEAWRQPGAMDGMFALYRREGIGPEDERSGALARGNYVPEMLSLVVLPRTLVIYSDDDAYADVGCFEGLERYVPSLTLRRVSGTHWIPEELPDAVNSEIRDFLRTLDTPRTIERGKAR